MRLRTMAAAALGLAAAAFCQTGDPRPRASRLRADLEFLCSDALAGRVSLGPGAEIAARYIAADFAKSGLRPGAGEGYLQPFPLVGYRGDPQKSILKLTRDGVTKAFHAGVDFAGSFPRRIEVKAPLVFAGYGITAPEYGYDDYANLDAAGKVVLVFDHEPQEDDPHSVFNGTGNTLHAGRQIKIANARRHGAAALLIASEPARLHAGLLERAPRGASQGQPMRAMAPTQALDDPGQIPAFSVSDNVFAELVASSGEKPTELERAINVSLHPHSSALGNTVVELAAAPAEATPGTSFNAAGLMEGSDPAREGETVLITAHYDHLGKQNGRLYPGANDNASGTVAVMELARLFAAARERPKRSLLFVVFGSEEESMLGSFYYTAHPLRPLEGTRAVINLDMIARDERHIPQSEGVIEIPADTSNEVNLVGTYYSPDLERVIERENQRVGLTLDTKFERDHALNTLFRCDHLPFLAAGIPAVWLFGGFHPGYHEPVDTVEKLNFAKMEKVIRLAYGVAAEIADTETGPRFGR